MGQAYVTSRVFWEITYKSSLVLVSLGLCRSDFVRLAGERGGVIMELLLLGNIGEGWDKVGGEV